MLEKDFSFDLQLFAEGDSVNATEPVEQPVEDSSNDEFDFGIDENGGVIFRDASEVFGVDEEPDIRESKEEEPVAPVQDDLYTVKVNGQEMQVPLNELLNGYMRNADYTHKTQALAEQRRALEQQYQQPKATPQPTPQPVEQNNPQDDQKLYYQKLADYAKGQVQQILGEEYDDFNPIHQAALADTVATIKAQVYQQQEAMRQREAVESRFNSMMDKYRQDPNFQAIDSFALEKFNELPYAQAIKIKEALDNRDASVIDTYYSAVVNEFYGNRNVPTITPPVKVQNRAKVPYVETAGVAPQNDVPSHRNIDWSKLGKLNTDKQAQLVRELGFLN